MAFLVRFLLQDAICTFISIYKAIIIDERTKINEKKIHRTFLGG